MTVVVGRLRSAVDRLPLGRRTFARVRNRVLSTVRATGRVSEVLVNRVLRRSDHKRWDDARSLEVWWESRTVQLASLVPPGSRVIEFGAGSCHLPKYLDRCEYIGSDLVSRESIGLVCDLNTRPLPDLRDRRLNVAVFAGVLEYVVDVPEVVHWLAPQVDMAVLSYDAIDSPKWSLRRVEERSRRRYFGYMNDYEKPAFVRVFQDAGFHLCREDRWQNQDLYFFKKTGT